MGDQQYLAHSLQHPDTLSATPTLAEGARSSAAPPASAYTVLTPYSNVSSFNYPAQCDSSLLTPISSAGSPPMHHIQKLGRQYPPPPSTPHPAQTPPEDTKMYNSWQFDAQGQTSQHSSPMIAAPAGPEFLNNYMPEDRRTPGPPDTAYMGNFGVSTGPETNAIENHPYYVQMQQPLEQQSHGMVLRDGLSMSEAHTGRALPTTPLLNQSQLPHFRQQRRTSLEDPMFQHHQPEASRSMSGSPRRKALIQGTGRVKKRATRRQSGSQKQNVPRDPADEHKNCWGKEVPPKMKNTCSEIDRLVVELRWVHRKKRGQDMWEAIQKDIYARLGDGKKYGREDLQMKFRRGRTHILWESKDEEILRDAWIAVESERYQNILNKFLELGGSRNMCLNAVDVEGKVTGLNLEEGMYINNPRQMQVRRRRKVPPKKRNGGPGHDDADTFELADRTSNSPHGNMTQEEIVEQIYRTRDAQWSVVNPGGSIMDMQLENGRAIKMEPGLEHCARGGM